MAARLNSQRGRQGDEAPGTACLSPCASSSPGQQMPRAAAQELERASSSVVIDGPTNQKGAARPVNAWWGLVIRRHMQQHRVGDQRPQALLVQGLERGGRYPFGSGGGEGSSGPGTCSVRSRAGARKQGETHRSPPTTPRAQASVSRQHPCARAKPQDPPRLLCAELGRHNTAGR